MTPVLIGVLSRADFRPQITPVTHRLGLQGGIRRVLMSSAPTSTRANKEMEGKKELYESRRQLRAEVQELRKRLARCERELRNVDAVIADKDVTYDQIRSWEDEGGSIS